MIQFTDITGLAGSALVIATVCLRLPGVARLGRGQRLGLAGAAFALAFIPLGGLSLAAYLRGGTGDLSIASLLLLLGALWRSICNHSGPSCDVLDVWQQGRQELLVSLLILAVMLYPMALGWGGFDPYRLGYGDPWFLSALLAMVLTAIAWRKPLLVLAFSLPVLAWAAGWYESANLWDYLLDPLVAIYAAGALARRAWAGLGRGKTV